MWRLVLPLQVLLIIQLCLLTTCLEESNKQSIRHHHSLHHRVPFHRRICERLPRHTTAQRTPGDNGFRIRILGDPSPDGYIPGEVYTVVINGTYPSQVFRGFMLVAVPQGAKTENVTEGTFKAFDDGYTKQARVCSHTVMMHQTLSKRVGEVSLMWVAPSAGTGCVELKATVIEHPHIWYKDDGALTKMFCEEGQGDGAAADTVPACCACGYASYKLTFVNNWSHHNHPRDYPPKIYEPLLHWSNIVGATHTNDYRLWAYGQYSSPGVKQVCEFGYPNTVEKELREHSTDIRTVIKTTSIFNLKETREARFTVDKTHHLFSFLSMVGPSPDWCVGLSGYDLCLPNCSWAGDQVIELFPWDAGTDSGITYMSKNTRSNPPEKIHRITNTFPAHSEAPFYNPSQPMRPLARLYLNRLYPRLDTDKCVEGIPEDPDEFDRSPSDDELVAMMKKKMMMQKKRQLEKCSTTDWADWTECTVTCGVGFKYRKRMFVNPMVSEDMCGLSLQETDNCIGIENTCGGDLRSIYSYRDEARSRLPNRKKNKQKFEVKYNEAPDPNDPCAMTPWSDWSPCSVSCGKGMHERFRMFLRKSGTDVCSQSRMEKEVCMSSVIDCDKATMMKNFTAVCSLRGDRGLCRGKFPRWYYDTNMGKCLPFDYTGCRGNDNNFETQRECDQLCGVHMASLHSPRNDGTGELQAGEPDALKLLMMKKQMMMKQQMERDQRERQEWEARQRAPKVDCMVTPWSDWTPCSVSCGKGITTKIRMIKIEPQNGGRKCPRRLMKKKKCKRRKCAKDCKLSRWTPWTECSETCGNHVIQQRTRRVVKRPKHGGRPCDPTLERRYCKLPACPNQGEKSASDRAGGYYYPMAQSGL